MDSQRAAFEKFLGSEQGERRSGRDGRSGGSGAHSAAGPMPDLYSIHRGTVNKVEEFGAFVQLPGFKRNGLVHKTQVSRRFVEKVSDVVSVGDTVWVKAISLQDDKIALSMKYVSQGDGEDLDPNLVQLTSAEDKRRVHTGFVDKGPISIEDGGVLRKTVCKKCGASGHLAIECYSGGEKFDLVNEDAFGEDDATAIGADQKASRHSRSGEKGGDSDKKRKDRHKDKDRDSRGKDRDRDRKKRDRSRSPKKRVENLDDALAVLRAHKHRKSKHKESGDSSDEDGGRFRRRSGRQGSRSRSRSPKRKSDRSRDSSHRDRDYDRDRSHHTGDKDKSRDRSRERHRDESHRDRRGGDRDRR